MADERQAAELIHKIQEFDFAGSLSKLNITVCDNSKEKRDIFMLKILNAIKRMMEVIEKGEENEWQEIIHLNKDIEPKHARYIVNHIITANDYLNKLVSVKEKTIELVHKTSMLSYLGIAENEMIYPVVTYVEISYSVPKLTKDTDTESITYPNIEN